MATYSHAPRRRWSIPLFVFWAGASILYALLFLTFEFHSHPVDSLASAATLAVQWAVVGVCASGIIGLAAVSRRLFAVVYPLLCLAGGVGAWFNIELGQRLTPVSLEIAMVNDASMWLTVVTPSLIAVAIGSLAVGAATAMIRIRFTTTGRGARPALLATGLVLTAIPTVAVHRINAMTASRLPYSLYYATRDYLRNRRTVASTRHTFDNISSTSPFAPSEAPDLLLIIGESLRADHLPMNGYGRNTMPCLSNDTSLVSFAGVRSEATHTYASVPCIMTRADSARANNEFSDQSFIPLFRRAGYRTAWFANQDLSSSYAYFAHEADTLFYGNAARSLYSYESWLDTDLLPEVGGWLDSNSGKPSLAILHTIGSHWWYPSHYTPADRLFTPDISHKDVGRLDGSHIINAYDNTIVATDRFLDSLFTILDERPRPAIALYISDHGEGLGEEGVWLHAAPAEPLHHPACLIRWNRAYSLAFPEKVAAARDGSARQADTRWIFHTLLDAASIQTPVFNNEQSLLTPSLP